MDITFYGVRGTSPAPGPATVRYGGNTSCVAVTLDDGSLLVLDCGTGARNLGLALKAGPFGRGEGRGTLLLSHAHWDHIQGFPFFVPFYVPGNTFAVHGGSISLTLEMVLEGQMAAQYFPVQSFRNMGAQLALHNVDEDVPFRVGDATVVAHSNAHGPHRALAFRIEDAGKVLVYASDVDYGGEAPSAAALALYQGADLLIHDSTYTPEDQAARPHRGQSSLTDAVAAAVAARVKRLVLFHYDHDYSDHELDGMVARGRRLLDERQAEEIEIIGAAEGLTMSI